MRNEIAIIIVALLIIGVSYGVGYANGARDMANWGVDVAMVLIDTNQLNIDIDAGLVTRGILQYQNQIGGCLFMQNASLYDNKGN